jgi:hypothetical protein
MNTHTRLALFILFAAAALPVCADLVIHTRDGRALRVPVDAQQVTSIDFEKNAPPPAPHHEQLSFLHAPGGPGANWSKSHPDTIINYLDWEGRKWSAKIQGDQFLHAPEGDWSLARVDEVIHYQSWNGSKWAAKIQGTQFIHAPEDNWGQAHQDDVAIYRTWDGSTWTARLVRGK